MGSTHSSRPGPNFPHQAMLELQRHQGNAQCLNVRYLGLRLFPFIPPGRQPTFLNSPKPLFPNLHKGRGWKKKSPAALNLWFLTEFLCSLCIFLSKSCETPWLNLPKYHKASTGFKGKDQRGEERLIKKCLVHPKWSHVVLLETKPLFCCHGTACFSWEKCDSSTGYCSHFRVGLNAHPSSHLTFILWALLFTLSTLVDLWENIIAIHCCFLSIHHPFSETYLGI